MSRPFSETTPPGGSTVSAFVVTVRVPVSGGIRPPVLPSGIGANFIRTLQDIPGESDSPSTQLFGAVPSVEKLPPLMAMLTIKIGSLFDSFALIFTKRSVVDPGRCLPNETSLGTIASVSGTGVAVAVAVAVGLMVAVGVIVAVGVGLIVGVAVGPGIISSSVTKALAPKFRGLAALLTVWNAPGVVGKSAE